MTEKNTSNSNLYDIAVIGAGPAGAIFVKELAQSRPDLKILLVDGQTSDSSKPCGGLLAPDAQKLLARFDMVLPKSILEDPQIFAVETIDIEQRLVRYHQRHYLNMNRYAFDSWLLSLVPSHVTICKGRCVEINKAEDVYNISIQPLGCKENSKENNKENRKGNHKENCEENCKEAYKKSSLQISAKTLVGADGGGSVVRRTFFKPMKVQYVALQQWFENKGQRMPYYSCIFDFKTSDSCSWTIHKGNYVIFGGAFAKQGCRQAFDTQKGRLEDFLGNSFGDAVKTEACLVSSPRSMKDYCTGDDNIYLLGEAAGFISASSFEGLSSAMLSGKILADIFATGKSHKEMQKKYHKSTLSLRLKLRTKSIKRTLLCSPFIRKIIMKSGVQSIKPYGKC